MKRSILLIEDNSDIREALATALTKHNLTVYQAPNGLMGYTMAIENEPDLILLDLMMPEMDGHTALTKLRQHPWGRHAKVVVLSAMDDVNNIGTAYEGRISDYIIKSNTSLEEILMKVQSLILETK